MAYRLLSIPMRILEPVFIPVENTLEAKGKWEYAQKLRKAQRYCRGIKPALFDAIMQRIQHYISLQEILQRETFLIEECERLRRYAKTQDGPATEQGKDQQDMLQRLERELQDLNEEYWQTNQRCRQHYGSKHGGPLHRGYTSTLRQPYWHLQEWLRMVCAREGGRCGRHCGCCEKPRGNRKECFGHCTITCGCCQQNRGFEIKRGSENHKLSHSPTNCLRRSRKHQSKLLQAYVWGI